jgi:hypothetical protein
VLTPRGRWSPAAGTIPGGGEQRSGYSPTCPVGAVIGTMLTPVTFPWMTDFCFLEAVPRASRVAAAFAALAAFCAAVRGAGT